MVEAILSCNLSDSSFLHSISCSSILATTFRWPRNKLSTFAAHCLSHYRLLLLYSSRLKNIQRWCLSVCDNKLSLTIIFVWKSPLVKNESCDLSWIANADMFPMTSFVCILHYYLLGEGVTSILNLCFDIFVCNILQ